MSREWFSAAELAGLPGVPTTKSGTIRYARREDWLSRQRSGRGGGREYHVTSLPDPARAELGRRALNERLQARQSAAKQAARRLDIAAAIGQASQARTQQTGLAQLARMSGTSRTRAEARLAILDALTAYRTESTLSPTHAMAAFCAAYNDDAIAVEGWVKDAIPNVCPQTLYRWRAQLQSDGAGRLAGRYGNRKGSGKIDRQPALYEFLTALIAEHPHVSPRHAYKAMLARFAGGELDLPSRRGVERWLAGWKAENRQLYTALTNPDAWKSKYMPAFGSASEDVVRLNQRWEMDSTPADVMLTDGRHSIIGAIDVYSRRVRLHVSKSSTAAAVASTLRRALLDWGVPEVIKTDNGADYTSHHIKRVIDALGVEQILCHPFSGWEKPHIERFFRTFSHDLVELLPGYIGHDVAERSEIEARKSFADRLMKKNAVVELKLSSRDLQAFCDRWLDTLYHAEPHEGLNGVSPLVKAAGQPSRRIEDERALDVLLADAPGDGWRTVGKKGVRLEGYTYIAPELGEWIGSRVRILHDPEDLGLIQVFGGQDMQHICVAECPEITGISRQEVAQVERARRTGRIERARRELKAAARKERTKDIVEEILGSAEAATDRVVPLPGRAEPYTSDGLEAARAAADVRAAMDEDKPIPPVDEAAIRRVAELARADQVQDETGEDRFRRWVRLSEQAEVSEIEQRWMRQFEDTPEYRSRKLILDEFGPEAFGLGGQ